MVTVALFVLTSREPFMGIEYEPRAVKADAEKQAPTLSAFQYRWQDGTQGPLVMRAGILSCTRRPER